MCVYVLMGDGAFHNRTLQMSVFIFLNVFAVRFSKEKILRSEFQKAVTLVVSF